ncbi:Linear gramicidin synthase subunit D (plasmid) [Ralstonia solanacearum]|nr:Linear gramicidin synthase subunit D [Ralstonia solanacearum]
MADDDSRPLADLPLLTPAQRQQVLVDWNATQAAYPRHTCLPQGFEAQVERTARCHRRHPRSRGN